MQEATKYTNQPFLWHVARNLLTRYGNDLSGLTIVFPNKRASLFFNEHLASLSSQPVWSPSYTTISDLFRKHSNLSVPDDIKLICDLHRSFCTCTGRSETLDKFFGWGAVLLSDFDDIDKSLANAHGLFANISELHFYDSSDYLSEEQRRVLQHFFKDFNENHNSDLKKKFLDLWSRLGNIYEDYNKRLLDQGYAYEGALFRKMVEDEEADYGNNTYIFVGFNALQAVEQRMFSKLKSNGQAEFFWDFDRYYMEEKTSGITHEAGAMIKAMLQHFPNQLDSSDSDIYDNLQSPKHITFIGAPTDSVQARYVGEWLSSGDRVESGHRTAVVMCNESLLPTVIHSIPDNVEEINITTGYPLMHTAAASLITLLTDLAYFGRSGSDKYRQKFVTSILRHPYSNYISPLSAELCIQLTENHRYFPTREELCLDDGLRLLFSDLSVSAEGEGEYDKIHRVNKWLLDILRRVAIEAKNSGDDSPLTHESLFRAYTLVNRLQVLIDSGDLKVDPTTYQRLLHQLEGSVSVPFHGEPAVSLQVMGVLETRNLDFEHLLLLSCNEGNMPKGVDSPSFIPQSLRKAFGLTTIDTKVGIYSYYFFRMLQRAKDITIMYGNAADDKNTGEKSRFMLQLMVESKHAIERKSLISEQKPTLHERYTVEKTDAVLRRLEEKDYISPTSINHFMRCQLQYFFSNVAEIREPDAPDDEIDNRIFGNIFHDASQFIYDKLTGTDRANLSGKDVFSGSSKVVTKSMIEYALNNDMILETALDKAFQIHLFKTNDIKSAPAYNGLQIINRRVILHYLRQLLKIDLSIAPFTIYGLEGDVFATINVSTSRGNRKVRIGGRIDRLDEVTATDGSRRIRVVDYKTGFHNIKVLDGVGAVFDPKNISNHSDYYLQAMLYAMIVSRSKKVNPENLPVSPALLFIQHAGAKDYDPILKFGNTEISDMRQYNEAFEEHLSKVVSQILEPNEPFKPTEDRKVCAKCAYKSLCGKVVNI